MSLREDLKSALRAARLYYEDGLTQQQVADELAVSRPQVSRWLSFLLLRSLARLDEVSDWVSLEPRTPFRAYPKRRKRH